MTPDPSIREFSRRADCLASVSMLYRSQVPHAELYVCCIQGEKLWVQQYFPFSFIKSPAGLEDTSLFSLIFLLMPYVYIHCMLLIFILNISGFHLKISTLHFRFVKMWKMCGASNSYPSKQLQTILCLKSAYCKPCNLLQFISFMECLEWRSNIVFLNNDNHI